MDLTIILFLSIIKVIHSNPISNRNQKIQHTSTPCSNLIQFNNLFYILDQKKNISGVPADMSVQWKTGTVYFTLISDEMKMTLQVLEPNGELSVIKVAGLGQSTCVDNLNDVIYLATDNGVYKYKEEGAIELYTALGEDVMYVAVNSDGSVMYIATWPQNRVHKITNNGQTQELFSAIPNGHGLTVDPKNNIYFVATKTLYILKSGHKLPIKIKGLPSDKMTGVFVTRSDEVYGMDEKSNLYVIDPDRTSAKLLGNFNVEGVNSFAMDASDNILIGIKGAIMKYTAYDKNPCPATETINLDNNRIVFQAHKRDETDEENEMAKRIWDTLRINLDNNKIVFQAHKRDETDEEYEMAKRIWNTLRGISSQQKDIVYKKLADVIAKENMERNIDNDQAARHVLQKKDYNFYWFHDIQSSTNTASALTETASDVTETESAVTETASAVTETNSPVTETASAVTETELTVTETASAVTETGSAVTETESAVTETEFAVTETESAVTETESAVTETESAVTETESAVTETESTVTETASAVTVTALAVTETESAVTETESTVRETASAVTETGSAITETESAGTETELAVTETESAVTETESADTETESTVTETASAVTETGSAITETESAGTETELAVTETESAVTETESAVTETESAVTETESTVTETASAVTEIESAVTETAIKVIRTKLFEHNGRSLENIKHSTIKATTETASASAVTQEENNINREDFGRLIIEMNSNLLSKAIHIPKKDTSKSSDKAAKLKLSPFQNTYKGKATRTSPSATATTIAVRTAVRDVTIYSR